MAAKNVGTLIKEARTAKKYSQEQVASQVDGLSGSDLGKAERGEKVLSQAQLRVIAKILGVTQKSLLEAPAGGTNGTKTASASKTTAAKKPAAKTSSAKTGTAKATTATTSTAGKTTAAKSTAAKTTTAAKTAVKGNTLTTAEKNFLELYRNADSSSKKLAARILKGEKLELTDLLNSGSFGEDGLLGSLLGKIPGLMK